MRLKSSKRINSLLLCMMLIVAMAITMVGCGAKDSGDSNQSSTKAQGNEDVEIKVLGEGQTKFSFMVVDEDGNETAFEIHTDKTTVGEALLDVQLIEGEASEYGLYVKKVNGITADYDETKTYWAFYVNGEYAAAGVDTTTIEDGATYSFKVEK